MVRKRFKKGSAAAKAYMAKIRSKRGGTSSRKRTRSPAIRHLRVKPIKRRRYQMAKRRSFRRSSGGKNYMNGLFKPTGIIAAALIGFGAASASSMIPINVPYKEEIAAFVVGGVPAAGAVLLLKGVSGTGSGTQFTASGY